MPAPVRYPSGVSTASKNTTLWNLPSEDPTKLYTQFNDFSVYAAGDWTLTQVAGSGTCAVVAGDPGGSVLLSNAASTDNHETQIQCPTAGFTLATGKKAWFKTRIKVQDATELDWVAGLCVLDTTLMGSVSGAGMTDGIFFNKDDDDTQIDINCQKNATTGQLRKANVATATTSYMVLGWEWDGARYVRVFFNDACVHTLDLTATPTAFLPDAALAVSFAVRNGTTATGTMTIDYLIT